MIEPIFTKEHIDSMRPHIQKTVDDLLTTMISEGGSTPVDIVEKFALPVPSYV
jgi:nitric oxide reductase